MEAETLKQTDLVVLERMDPITLFQKDGLAPIVDLIVTESRSIVGDISTPAGRFLTTQTIKKIVQGLESLPK